MGGLSHWWRLVSQPMGFFEAYQAPPPDVRAGATSPLVCAALYLAFAVAMTVRVEPVVLEAVEDARVPSFLLSSTMYGSAVAGGLAYPLLWLASAGLLVAIDALFVGRADALKQLELAGRAFASQLPGLTLLLAATVSLDEGLFRDVDVTHPEGARRLRARLAGDPLFSATTTAIELSQVWLCGLLAASYRCLARIGSATTTFVAAALYAALFLGALVWRLGR